jgi:type I restriction enzyme S subunit
MNKEKQVLVPELRFPEFSNEGKWQEKKFCEVGVFIGGGTPSTSNPEFWGGEIQWYTPTEVKNGILKSSIRTITELGLKKSSAKLLPKGTILLTTRATIGDVAITESECATNQGFQSLVVNKSEVNLFWFYWVLKHKNELIRRSSGSTFKEIGKTEINSIPTLSPNKEEQCKIANCLFSLDTLISSESDKLDYLKDHKKGLLQQLLPAVEETKPQFRFSEFINDGDWEETILENVADYANGKAHEKEISAKGKYKVVNSKFISTEGRVVKFTDSANLKANIGDVLMVLSDIPNGKAIAKCFYVDKEDTYTVNQRICKITPTDIDNKFLFYIQNRNSYFLGFDDGVKQTNLRKDAVLSFPFLKPKDPKEQQKIASCLSSADDLIEAQKIKIKSLKSHKKGLMQQLFPNINDIS